MHYFRIHPDYWRDRLEKMKACGLNTVETYMELLGQSQGFILYRTDF